MLLGTPSPCLAKNSILRRQEVSFTISIPCLTAWFTKEDNRLLWEGNVPARLEGSDAISISAV